MTTHPLVEAVARGICCPNGCMFAPCHSYQINDVALDTIKTVLGYEPSDGALQAGRDQLHLILHTAGSVHRAITTAILMEMEEE